MEADKFTKKSVSLRESLLKKAEARALTTKGGNLSAYISSLIEKDLSTPAASDAISPRILEDLTRRLLGELDEGDMATICRGENQPRRLAQMLRSLLAVEGARMGLHPEAAGMLNESADTSSLIGRVETDARRLVTKINEDFTRICGYTFAEIKGKNLRDILQGPATEPGAKLAISNAIHARKEVAATITNYHKNGSLYVANVVIRPTPEGFEAEVRLAPTKIRTSSDPEGDALRDRSKSVGPFPIAPKPKMPDAGKDRGL